MNKKAKIYLVDDDSLIVSMLSRALKNEGYEVRSESEKFSSVLDTIASWSPDVMFS